jgi:hypothetical protein
VANQFSRVREFLPVLHLVESRDAHPGTARSRRAPDATVIRHVRKRGSSRCAAHPANKKRGRSQPDPEKGPARPRSELTRSSSGRAPSHAR